MAKISKAKPTADSITPAQTAKVIRAGGKSRAVIALKRAGIITKNGELSLAYRSTRPNRAVRAADDPQPPSNGARG